MTLRTVEVLRGLAAVSVAVAHSDSLIGSNAHLPFGRWHSFAMPGTAGVEFFFVLSGFVMTLAHGGEIGRGGQVGRFLWKRFCRIYPLYWIVLAVPLHRFWGAPSLTPEAIAGWASLLPVRSDNLLVVAWTLRQEVTFYAVLAVCLLPWIGRYVLGAWVIGTCMWWFVVPPPNLAGVGRLVFGQVFSLFNFEFFAGLLVGWLLPRWPGRAWVGWATVAVGLVVLGWRMSLDGWGVEYGPAAARPVYGFAYGAVLLGFAGLERSGALRFGRRGVWLASAAGALSYPLYLSHLLTLDVVAEWLGASRMAAQIGPDWTFVAMVGAAVLVAGMLAALVDRPLQRLLRQLGARKQGAALPGPAV